MDAGMRILSEATIHSKYARYLDKEARRESFSEIIERNKTMHLLKFPQLEAEINRAYELVHAGLVLPSMRSMQFAGPAIAANQARINNCAYTPADNYRCFSEVMFLLLGGTGVGYSVEHQNINQLPVLVEPGIAQKYLIEDSIMGWAESVRVLVKAYLFGNTLPQFDYSAIRPKGERLITSGGKAPGAAPLRAALVSLKKILKGAVGRQLTSFEIHCMMCVMADAVLAGGIRRAAMIAFFDKEDTEMATCKHGQWWIKRPYLGRSNNSMVAYRDSFTAEDFKTYWKYVSDSKCGEPGLFWTSSRTARGNPCVEAGLDPNTFCNLGELNANIIYSQEIYNEAAWAVSFIDTLQASYTDFHYLRPIWKEATERDALIGVGITGLAHKEFLKLNHIEAATIVNKTNKELTARIGINQAARCTVIKPSGTTSIVLGSSSGIHAWHSEFYIRRIRVGKHEAIYNFFKENLPEFIEDDKEKPEIQAILGIPCRAPADALLRDEGALNLLQRVEKFYTDWIIPGHNRGLNGHSVSVTVSIKEEEWDLVGEWLWVNRDAYACTSVLPYDGGTYIQAPFESITEDYYWELYNKLPTNLDFTQIIELDDNTSNTEEAACAGGACII